MSGTITSRISHQTHTVQAWLKFPEQDPFKNKELQAELAIEVTDELIETYQVSRRFASVVA